MHTEKSLLQLPGFGRKSASIAISGLLVLFAPVAAWADFLFERWSHDVLVASDSIAYICSVEHDESENATVGLREIDLTTGTVGPREVIFTQVAPVPTATTQECSLELSGDGEKLVILYDINVPPLSADQLGTATKDLVGGSVTTRSHLFSGLVASFSAPNLVVRQLNGVWFLFTFATGSVGTEGVLNAMRFPSLADLEANTNKEQLVLWTEDGAPIPFPKRMPGSLFATVDQSANNIRFGYFKIDSPAKINLGTIGTTGGPTLSTINDVLVALSGMSDHGEMAARTSDDRYFNTATGRWTYVVLKSPYLLAGYRLDIDEENGALNAVVHSLVNPAGPYGLGPMAPGPDIFGFPATMDVLLSDGDEWVFASRDHNTDLVALDRIPAAFESDPGPELVNLGTRLPGAEFCGEQMTFPEEELADFYHQNDFLKVRRLPNGTHILVVYLTCPDGDPANAELVARVVPLSFPRLVDDNFGAIPRGETFEVPAPGVLANDSQLDGATPVLNSGPEHGTAEVSADGSFSYTPDPSWCGVDSFLYSVPNSGTDFAARVTVFVSCPADLLWTFDEFTPGQGPLELNQRIKDHGGAGRDGHVYHFFSDDGPSGIQGAPLTGDSTALAFNPDTELVRFVPGFSGFPDGGPAAGTDIQVGESTPLTLEVIARTNGAVSTFQVLAGKVEGDGAGPSWFLQVTDGGLLQGVLTDGGNTTTVTSSQPVDDNEWHHFALVRDTLNSQARLFVDRDLVASASDTTGSLITNSPFAAAAFGEDSNFGRQFDGAIDEVRVVLRALKPLEFVYGRSGEFISDGFEQ